MKLVLLTTLLLLTYWGNTQSITSYFSPKFYNYNVDNGLPSNETYHVLQDKAGMIWIATDNGVCRFDGSNMRMFTMEHGLPDNVILKFFEDGKGRVWFSCRNQNLCYFYQDSIHVYKYNHIIKKHIPSITSNIGLVVDSLDNVYLGYRRYGYLEINAQGEALRYKKENIGNPRGISNAYIKPVGNNVVSFNIASQTLDKRKQGEKITPYVCLLDGGKPFNLVYKKELTGYAKVQVQGVNYTCMLDDSSYAFLCKGEVLRLFQDRIEGIDTINQDLIYIKRLNDLLWVGTKHHGVYAYSIKDGFKQKEHFLKDYSVTGFCRDIEGGYWFSTLESGVFYAPNLDCRTYVNKWNMSNAICMAIGKQNKAYVGYDDGTLHEVTTKAFGKNYPIVLKGDNRLYHLSFFNDTLFCSAKKAYAALTNKENKIIPTIYDGKMLRHSNGRLYQTLYATMDIEQTDGSFRRLRADSKISDMEEYGENIILATSDGLMVTEGDTIVKALNLLKSKRHVRVTGIERLGDDYFFVTKAGLFFRFNRKNKAVTQFKFPYKVQRYSALRIHKNKEIWLASEKGILITYLNNLDSFNVLTPMNGLPRGLIVDIQFDEEYAWLLTSDGPSYIKLGTMHQTVPKILLTAIKVNDVDVPIQDSMVLPYSQNQLEFQYGIHSYKKSEYIGYRYFLKNEDRDTVWTQNNSVRYPSLEPGEYTFFIATSLDGIHYSPYRVVHVTIEKPFWLESWFLFVGTLIFWLFIALIVRYRINLNNRKAAIQHQLVELRSQALRAQMNPHFTFNALNSIQSLIALDENEKASIYLAEFARLMRSTLDASSAHVHSLEDELEIVSSYLSLEKLRFKELINYKINVNDEVDLQKTAIPPMIVQPLVENSIIHGLLPKKDVGMIELNIRMLNEHTLQIEIKDNGLGFDTSQKNKKSSKGTKMIEERLKLIDAKNQLKITSSTVEPKGTIAQININI